MALNTPSCKTSQEIFLLFLPL
ncbi:hypothetical protein LINGRAHAP2_LOCUS23577 [Linum grandiflorum]